MRIDPNDQAADAHLIARLADGDDSAAEELFARHRDAVRRSLAHHATPTEADDITSEAFLRVISVIKAGNGPSRSFRSYVMTAARNIRIDMVRRDARVTVTDEVPDEEHPAAEDALLVSLRSDLLAKAYSSLSPRSQEVLWRATVDDESARTIAADWDITPGLVYKIVERARRELRSAYLIAHTALEDRARDCQTVVAAVPSVLDGRSSAAEVRRVDEHLECCEACRSARDAMSEVSSGYLQLGLAALLGVRAAPLSVRDLTVVDGSGSSLKTLLSRRHLATRAKAVAVASVMLATASTAPAVLPAGVASHTSAPVSPAAVSPMRAPEPAQPTPAAKPRPKRPASKPDRPPVPKQPIGDPRLLTPQFVPRPDDPQRVSFTADTTPEASEVVVTIAGVELGQVVAKGAWSCHRLPRDRFRCDLPPGSTSSATFLLDPPSSFRVTAELTTPGLSDTNLGNNRVSVKYYLPGV